MYSRSVRVVRVASEELGCAYPRTSVGASGTLTGTRDLWAGASLANMSTFADKLYTKYLYRGYPPTEVYGKIIDDSGSFFINTLSNLQSFQRPLARGHQPNAIQDDLQRLTFYQDERSYGKRVTKINLTSSCGISES